MTLHTTYFGAIGSSVEPDEDADVFAVVRYPQDFIESVTDRNIPTFAPPEELLNAYKAVEAAADRDDIQNASAVAWDSVDFEERYRDHLNSTGPKQVLNEIRAQLRDRVDIWIVCWEKDVRYCHRRVLADVLVEGTDVEVDHHPSPDEMVDETDCTPRSVSLRDFQEGSV